MGSCCSTEGSDERCMYCNHRAVNNLQIIDYVCEICIVNNARRQELDLHSNKEIIGSIQSTSLSRRQSHRALLFRSPTPIQPTSRISTYPYITAATNLFQRSARSPATTAGPEGPKKSRSQSSSATGGPYFGEYRCSSCRRTWCSRLSWPHSYQICKRCRSHVYAHTQRALIPSDRTADRENRPEHQMDGCQMCQQLGYYCGNFNRRVGNRGKY